MANHTLITGASEGLGVEFARLAAKEGRNLILTARSGDKLEALADELRSKRCEVIVITADLAADGEAARLWKSATDGRTVDVLVNNAGLGSYGPFSAADTWDRELNSMQVNITALTYLMKQAIPHMEAAGGGRILNVASIAGFFPGPGMAIYHATKAFVLSLSEAVASELSGSKVTVSAICPGPTATNFFDVADMNGMRAHKVARPMKASEVAKIGWIQGRVGRRVSIPGFSNVILANLPRITPRPVMTAAIRYFSQKP